MAFYFTHHIHNTYFNLKLCIKTISISISPESRWKSSNYSNEFQPVFSVHCPLYSLPPQIESFKPFFIIYHGDPELCQSNTTQKQFFLELNFIEQFVLRSGTKLRQILFAQDNFKINFQHEQRKRKPVRPGTNCLNSRYLSKLLPKGFWAGKLYGKF